MELHEILDRFENVKPSGNNFSARCPGPGHDHGDRHNSLTIYVNTTDEGKEAVYFQCGVCEHDEIREAVGLEKKDLFLGESPNSNYKTENKKANSVNTKPKKQKVTSEKYQRSDNVAPLRAYNQDEYPYADASGKVVAKKVRKEGKCFFWEPKKSDVLEAEKSFPPVFRFDRLIKASEDETIYICEGEKDVLTLESYGKTAICLPYGASTTSDFRDLRENDDFRRAINGKRIVILPDFDNVGEISAQNLRKLIYSIQDIRFPVAIISWKNLEPEICKMVKTNDFVKYIGAGFDLTDFLELHPEDGIARIVEAANAHIRAAAVRTENAERKRIEKEETIQAELDQSLEPIQDLLTTYPGLATFYDQYANRVKIIEKKETKDLTDKDRQIRHDFKKSLKEAQKLQDESSSSDDKIKYRASDILNIANDIITENILIEDIYPVRIDKSSLLELLIDKKHAYTHDGKLWLYNDQTGIYKGFGIDRQGEILVKYTKVFGSENIYSKKNVDEFKSLIKNTEDSNEDRLLAPVRPEMKAIAFTNGTFDIEKRKLVPHSPKYLLKYQIDADFDEDFFNSPIKEIERWTKEESHFYKFLREIQPDPLDQKDIMMHFSLVISPHAVTGKIPLICYYGSGVNGKSTLLELMMRLIVDEREHNACLPWERLTSPKGFDLSRIDGKSINLVPDTSTPNHGDSLLTGGLKSMTTGEPFLVEHKYVESDVIHPNITSIVCLNRLPNISEKGESTERRIHILPFNRKIGTQQEVDEGTKDLVYKNKINLIQDILKEKDRLVVLFVLALYDLEKNNWTLPESQAYQVTKEGWLVDTDPVQAFCSLYLKKSSSFKEIPKDQKVELLNEYSFSLEEFTGYLKSYLLIKGTEKKDIPSKDECRHQIEQVLQIKPDRKLLPDGSRPTRYYGYSLSSWIYDSINRYHIDDPDKYDKMLQGRYNINWETQPSSGTAIPESTSALISKKDQEITLLKSEVERLKIVIEAQKQAMIDHYENDPGSEDPLDGFIEVI